MGIKLRNCSGKLLAEFVCGPLTAAKRAGKKGRLPGCCNVLSNCFPHCVTTSESFTLEPFTLEPFVETRLLPGPADQTSRAFAASPSQAQTLPSQAQTPPSRAPLPQGGAAGRSARSRFRHSARGNSLPRHDAMVVFELCTAKKNNKNKNKLMCAHLEFVALNLSHRSKRRTRRGQCLFGAA